jgi:hypothetical protein
MSVLGSMIGLPIAIAAMAVSAVGGTTERAAPMIAGKVLHVARAAEGTKCWLTVRALSAKQSRPLTRPVGKTERRCDHSGAWSPDASKVAFVRETPGRLTLMVVNANGTGLRRVATIDQRARGAWGVRWSPAGTDLLFEVDRRPSSGTNALYRIRVDGSGLRLLALQPDRVGFLDGYGWSPDGAKVALVRSVGEPRYPAYTGPAQLQTISSDGSGLKTLLAAESVDWAAWSPDGTRLALQRNCFNQICQLAVIDPIGGAVEALTYFAHHSSVSGVDQLSSAWRPLKPTPTLVYARERVLYEVSPATGTTRIVGKLPCPREHCDASIVTLANISSDGRYAVVDDYEYSTLTTSTTEPEADPCYLVDLNTGKLTDVPSYSYWDGDDVFLP